jgi:uncharacterized protein YndB with AHSA1/START domain
MAMPKSLERLADLSGFPATEITRVFDAPRALVYQAWTDPKHMARWWGPKEFTNPRCDMDVRVGGAIRIDMKAPNGTVYPMPGIFTLVDPPKALAFRCGAADADGDQIFEVLNSVRFDEEPGGKTRIHILATMQWARPEAAPMWGGNVPGWNQSLVKLAALLAEA